MIKLVGSLLAFTALAVSLLTGADPWTCLTRSATAFLIGGVAASLWSGIVSSVQAPKEASFEFKSPDSVNADGDESKEQKAA